MYDHRMESYNKWFDNFYFIFMSLNLTFFFYFLFL